MTKRNHHHSGRRHDTALKSSQSRAPSVADALNAYEHLCKSSGAPPDPDVRIFISRSSTPSQRRELERAAKAFDTLKP